MQCEITVKSFQSTLKAEPIEQEKLRIVLNASDTNYQIVRNIVADFISTQFSFLEIPGLNLYQITVHIKEPFA